MKIIVDEMPKSASKCLFSNYCGDGYFNCTFKANCTFDGVGCEHLKLIHKEVLWKN